MLLQFCFGFAFFQELHVFLRVAKHVFQYFSTLFYILCSTFVNMWCFLALRTCENVLVRVWYVKTTTCQCDDNNTTDNDKKMTTNDINTTRCPRWYLQKAPTGTRTNTNHSTPQHTTAQHTTTHHTTQQHTTQQHPQPHRTHNTHRQTHNTQLSPSLSFFRSLCIPSFVSLSRPEEIKVGCESIYPTTLPSLRSLGLDTRVKHACWTPWSVLLWCCSLLLCVVVLVVLVWCCGCWWCCCGCGGTRWSGVLWWVRVGRGFENAPETHHEASLP